MTETADKCTLGQTIKTDPILLEFEARLVAALNYAYNCEIPSAMIMSVLDMQSLHIKLGALERSKL